MFPRKTFVLFIISFIKNSGSEIDSNKYKGDKFPTKYLETEDYVPSKKDVDVYLLALDRIMDYFLSEPNNTDVNRAVSMFISKGVLKKTLQDDGNKLPKYQYDFIKTFIKCADTLISHYVYDVRSNFNTITDKVCQLLRNEELYLNSLKKFTKNRLKTRILNDTKINDFVEEMDAATLPRETYATLTVNSSMKDYYINISSSDTCISRVAHNLEPSVENTKLIPCKRDLFCMRHIYGIPSIAYGLSHKFLNMFLYRSLRHCYWVSPKVDESYMEFLCAFMYREAVYLARKGYFARDMFLEHVALCGQMGYEEFYRRHWFRKVISWIDGDGCIRENYNFEINVNKAYRVQYRNDKAMLKRLRRQLRKELVNDCNDHPMSLAVVMLANAVRHAAHFLDRGV